eukprot:Rhum_TRINITY_DN14027_c5_g1::Rhum_TRINITY_DN14027_c5_g1_i1::g.67980::m.67980
MQDFTRAGGQVRGAVGGKQNTVHNDTFLLRRPTIVGRYQLVRVEVQGSAFTYLRISREYMYIYIYIYFVMVRVLATLCAVCLLAVGSFAQIDREAFKAKVAVEMVDILMGLVERGYTNQDCKIAEAQPVAVGEFAADLVDATILLHGGGEDDDVDTEAEQHAAEQSLVTLRSWVFQEFAGRAQLDATENTALYVVATWLSKRDERSRSELQWVLGNDDDDDEFFNSSP